MARFILDIANLPSNKVKKVCETVLESLNTDLTSGVLSINCVDITNANQFHNEFENGETNKLTEDQIFAFSLVCDE